MEPILSQLSESQVRHFHEKGFLSVDTIAAPDEVEQMRAVYDRLFEMRAGRDVGDHFDLAGADEDGVTPVLQQILSPSRYAPELDELPCVGKALAMATQLLGTGTEAQGNHAILKPAGMGAATPWHQDEAYWGPEMAYNALSFWMPLQPATLENGCMHFVPGSHRSEVLPHHPINHDPRVHGLEVDDAVDDSRAVACPLPAGGATFHLARTLHYAGENRTDQPRRAYIMMFGTPPKPYDGERRFPWLEARQTARDARAAGTASPKPA
jgi:ectoine hydroxylase-related dioxygenase (phytanoyl-CoA dioxygenase family)